jgi:peptidoglycan/LPS O-acetylase OafA/YrhL
VDKNYSTYLDAVRFTAAVAVVFTHSRHLIGDMVPYQPSLGLDAVAVFFVLSGYVITFAAYERERTFSSFVINRLARVYSVALAGIVISAAVQALSAAYDPDPQQTYQLAGWWKYLPLFLTFTFQTGPIREQVFGNFPFYTLAFEVWYYIGFAVAFFYTGRRRMLLLAAVLALMVDRILLYFPIWIAGALLYRWHPYINLNPSFARVLHGVSLVSLFALPLSGASEALDDAFRAALSGWSYSHRDWSDHFASFYLESGLTVLTLLAARHCRFRSLDHPRIRAGIVYLASFTFTLYLIHWPLMRVPLILGYDCRSPLGVMALIIWIAGATWLIGRFTEHRKLAYRRLFAALISTTQRSLQRRAPVLLRLASP